MKKGILLLVICMTGFTVHAQVFIENFETATINGNVEGYNEWKVSPKAADALGVSPKIGEGALFYSGYAGSNIGNVAVLDSAIGVTSATQRISTRIVKFGNDTLKPVVGKKIYAAFIVNVSENSYRSYRDFFTFEGSKTTSSTRGRVFAKVNTAGDVLYLAVSKNSSSASGYIESTTLTSLSLSTGINHLLVLCYETLDGTYNDKVSLYINPDLTKTEAEQTNILMSIDNTAIEDYALSAGLGINLRQRGIGAQIGGIRVGKSWDSVVLGINTGFNQPNINNNIYSSGKSIYTDESGKLTIYNLSGAEVLSAKTTGKLETSLNKGMYLVKFVNDNGSISSGKIQLK